MGHKEIIMIIFSMKKYYKIYEEESIKWTPKRKRMLWSDPMVYQRIRFLNIWTPFMKRLTKNKVIELHKRIRLI